MSFYSDCSWSSWPRRGLIIICSRRIFRLQIIRVGLCFSDEIMVQFGEECRDSGDLQHAFELGANAEAARQLTTYSTHSSWVQMLKPRGSLTTYSRYVACFLPQISGRFINALGCSTPKYVQFLRPKKYSMRQNIQYWNSRISIAFQYCIFWRILYLPQHLQFGDIRNMQVCLPSDYLEN
jgi:hypothetical protein